MQMHLDRDIQHNLLVKRVLAFVEHKTVAVQNNSSGLMKMACQMAFFCFVLFCLIHLLRKLPEILPISSLLCSMMRL